MWRTAPRSEPSRHADSLVVDGRRRRLRRRGLAGTVIVALAMAGLGAAPAHAAPETQGVITWGEGPAVPPEAQSGVIAIDAGTGVPVHSLALKQDGSVIAWGSDNTQGQLTVPPEAQSGVVAISAGSQYSLALKSDGTVIGWGANGDGQSTPPSGLTGVVAIAAGSAHALALTSDGGVVAWGSNAGGQTTVPPAAQSGVVAIDAGPNTSYAVTSDGSVIGWGQNSAGRLDIPPEAESGVIDVAAGTSYALALKADGSVIGWGGTSPEYAAAPPEAKSGVVQIAADTTFSMALKSDGTVVAWGLSQVALPLPPEATSGVLAIAAGNVYGLALKDLGRAPTLTGTPPTGTVGEPYSFAYDVAGTPTPSVSLFDGTSLPPGLTLSADGVVSGTPTAPGEYHFLLVAFNGVEPDAILGSTITVLQAPTLAGSPPAGTVGQPYSFGYTVTGAPTPTVSLLDGTALPPGLALSPNGVLSGTPTTAGTFSFTVVASNGVNPTAYLESTITVAPAPKPKADVSVAITGPSTARRGVPVTYQVAVANAGPQTSVNVGATILVSTDFTIQAVPAGATRIGQLVAFPTASYSAGQQRVFSVTLMPKASSGTALLAAAAGSLVTLDPKLTNNAAAKAVKLSR